METTLSNATPGDGPGHAVQDVALFAVALGKPLGDNPDNDFIRHQLARVHKRLGLQAGRSAVLHCRPEDVAGRNGWDIQLLAQNFGLGPLSGAGGT